VAADYDVAARLAEGQQAAANIQSYVWASHLLGYQNPDLTLHPSQVDDWLSTEEGMDLTSVDADREELDAIAAAAEHALQLQDSAMAALASAWAGDGAVAAQEFLQRHRLSAAAVAAALRATSDALAELRDGLWHLVDAKVADLAAIEDRRQAQRPSWLAAAQTITTGVGDRASAAELTEAQIKPYVDNDIRVDWLGVVRHTIAAIGERYDAAIADFGAPSAARFDVPVDLRPTWEPAATLPAAVTNTPMATPATPSLPTPVMTMPPSTAMPAMATPASTAMPDPVGGLGGLGQMIADAIGGLLDSSVDESSDPQERVDEPRNQENDEEDHHEEEHEQGPKPDDSRPEAEAESLPGVVEDPKTDTAAPDAAKPAPQAPPAQAPSPAAPGAVTATPATETPCEIAADELPQAGE
jgi:uncharacterized protein YukE